MIEQQFTPETFTSFAFEQLRKASSEDENVAKIRVLALSQSIDVAKASFEQATTAQVPVIEAATTEQNISHQDALGSTRGGAMVNPEDLGTDLTKALDGLTSALAPKKTEVYAETLVAKSAGDPNISFEDIDNGAWPSDMSIGRVDAEWGEDSK